MCEAPHRLQLKLHLSFFSSNAKGDYTTKGDYTMDVCLLIINSEIALLSYGMLWFIVLSDGEINWPKKSTS